MYTLKMLECAVSDNVCYLIPCTDFVVVQEIQIIDLFKSHAGGYILAFSV